MLLDLSATLATDDFAHRARHPDWPGAFTRTRSLPLPALVASLLSMRSSSQQVLLDSFFARLCGDGALLRVVSDRAFAQARARLHAPALSWLNDRLLAGADAAGLVTRWQGLRLVAADASVLMPAVRRCHLSRSAAGADQRLFALYLPAAELTLHAAVHSGAESERAMLVQALDKLAPDDVLLLDRGYPAAWLINLLNERGVRFIMRCDTAGSGSWPALRAFMRGDQTEAVVRLSAPKQQDANDWGCSNQAPTVRLVRNTATATASQHALLVDVAAKVLADNIAALMCLAAQDAAQLPANRRCQRTHADAAVRAVLPRVLLAVGDVLGLIDDTLQLIARTVHRITPGRCAPRDPGRSKPHPRLAYRAGAA